MALANNGSEAEATEQPEHSGVEQHSTKVLMLGALGVVYGDIGTSPIYAFREALVAASGSELTKRDREICARMAEDLRRDGLIFVGLDVIGGYLTEVNVTSPTGIQEIDQLCGTNLAADMIDWIEEHAGEN